MPKVLIIEDRRENIVFIANNILRPMGYDVITARDGQTGLKKAEAEMPDLIITDLKLPRMHGLDVLENLLKKGIMIPTIVMTFHGSEQTAVRALRLGARDYLIKPFTMEEMSAALERALRPMPTSPEAYREKLDSQVKIKGLEEELEKCKALIKARGTQLLELQKQSVNSVDKVDMAEVAQRAAAWEEDSARLNEALSQNKAALSKAISRATALEETLVVQKKQTLKYQREARRLAVELRNLSEAIRLMAQDMDQQIGRMAALTPVAKEGT